MPYRVQLDKFDGPLDLLLFLIKKNEIDLFDIPIANLTQQYLDYIEVLRMLDLEGASDYILMAATLIRIKAKMLLPKPPIELDEDEDEDPRDELVRKLMEYQRFKEVAGKLSEREEERRLVYSRTWFNFDLGEESDVVWEPEISFTLFDLVGAFKSFLQRAPKVTEHQVQTFPVTAEEQSEFILKKLEERDGEILFYELLEGLENRVIMIVTFLALLELIKNLAVEVTQSSTFGEIWLRKR